MMYIAHRGYSSKQTENTLEAAVIAGKSDYFYGIEFDIHLTKDNEFIVFHDDNTKRLADRDIIIKEATFAEVMELNLINKKTKKYDLKIPTLKSYLEVVNKYGKVAVLEMKVEFTLKQIKLLLEAAKLANDLIIISFHLNNLLRVRKLNKKIKLQYLTSKFNLENFETCLANKIDLDLNYNLITKENMSYFKSKGFIVNCWTVNKLPLANKLKKLGVNFITTDGLKQY